MTISPILLYLWAGLFFCFTALLVYRGTLTRYENDQLFLHEEEAEIAERNKLRHNKLLLQLARLRPIVGSVGAAAGVVTATVVSIYVYNAWQNIPKF